MEQRTGAGVAVTASLAALVGAAFGVWLAYLAIGDLTFGSVLVFDGALLLPTTCGGIAAWIVLRSARVDRAGFTALLSALAALPLAHVGVMVYLADTLIQLLLDPDAPPFSQPTVWALAVLPPAAGALLACSVVPTAAESFRGIARGNTVYWRAAIGTFAGLVLATRVLAVVVGTSPDQIFGSLRYVVFLAYPVIGSLGTAAGIALALRGADVGRVLVVGLGTACATASLIVVFPDIALLTLAGLPLSLFVVPFIAGGIAYGLDSALGLGGMSKVRVLEPLPHIGERVASIGGRPEVPMPGYVPSYRELAESGLPPVDHSGPQEPRAAWSAAASEGPQFETAAFSGPTPPGGVAVPPRSAFGTAPEPAHAWEVGALGAPALGAFGHDLPAFAAPPPPPPPRVTDAPPPTPGAGGTTFAAGTTFTPHPDGH